MTNFKERFKYRPLSHSQLSSWEWNPAQWYDQYILNKREPATPAMKYGNVVGDSIGTKDSLVPTLQPPGVKEYELRGNIDEIHMVGYADHYCPDTLVLHENKTSDNPKRWNQKKVDTHPQLDMYLLLLFLSEKIKPEDVTVYLNFIPVKRDGSMVYSCPGKYKQFKTKRTAVDLLSYAQYVKDTVEKMDEYVASIRNT